MRGSRWVPLSIKSNPCRVFFWRGSLIHISRYSFTHFPAHADRARAPALTPASPSLVIPRSTQNHHNAAAASFGVLVHEVLTQRVPFAGKSVAKVITAVVAKGHRPGYLEGEEAGCNPALVKLADVCWTQDPAVRFVCVCVCVCVCVTPSIHAVGVCCCCCCCWMGPRQPRLMFCCCGEQQLHPVCSMPVASMARCRDVQHQVCAPFVSTKPVRPTGEDSSTGECCMAADLQ